jgi:hypothetical protein
MFQEDPGIFLADFGVTVVCGAISTKGILDMPGGEVLGTSLDNDYTLTYLTAALPNLKYNDQIIVNGVTYLARKPNQLSDGVFSHCTLTLP